MKRQIALLFLGSLILTHSASYAMFGMLGRMMFGGGADVNQLGQVLVNNIDRIAQALQNAIANGAGDAAANIINNGAGALNNNLAQGGQADQAIRNFFAAFQRQLDNNGQGAAAANALRERIHDIFNGLRGDLNNMQNDFRNLGNDFRGGLDGTMRNLNGHFLKATGIGILGTAGIAVAYFGTRVLMNHVERLLKTPQLIDDSSPGLKSTWQRFKATLSSRKDSKKELIFAPDLERELARISTSVKNIHEQIRNGNKHIFYKNILLYGIPGTGKTEFAKKLAKESGLDWIIIKGGSFAKFGEKQGLQELDKLFAWAASKKGLLIFIDEADVFLTKREKLRPDSYQYKLLNNFLTFSGALSNECLFVFATNHPKLVDDAVVSRVGEAVEFKAPGLPERIKIIKSYVDQYLLQAYKSDLQKLHSIKRVMTPEKIEYIAQQTENCAPRDISILISNISTDITKELTAEIIDNAIARMKNKKTLNFNVEHSAPAAA